MINKDNIYFLTRNELKSKGAFQFKENDIIICNKYHIYIKFGKFKRPSLLTTVNTREDIRDLPIRKQPYYIRNFIERLPEDLEEVI